MHVASDKLYGGTGQIFVTRQLFVAERWVVIEQKSVTE